MLCLYLLQISLVYINTLLIQQVLSDPVWMQKMGPNELRALTPLRSIPTSILTAFFVWIWRSGCRLWRWPAKPSLS